ncbi:MAG TPA: hypothetical protein VGE98_01560 [Thermoanaerobaculia bacterium]
MPLPVAPKTPVIVLPGFYGSKLTERASGHLVWVDLAGLTSSATMDALRFDPGQPDRLQATGILDAVPILPFWSYDVYRSFVSFLETNLNLQVFEFWFDWRRSLADLTDGLQRRIGRVLGDTGAAKVSLLAHSQGGLVARACIDQFGLAEKIDWLVTFGTPHKGMLKTFKALTSGLSVFTFGAASVKAASRTLPAAYEMLPNDADDGLFQWQGMPQSPFAVTDWCQTPEMRKLLADAAKVVVRTLPPTLPVKSALIYGTLLSTTVQASGGPQGLSFRDLPQGDATVPEVSARGDGLTGDTLHRFAVPFCDHLLLFRQTQVQQDVLTPILLGRPLPSAYLLAAFQSAPVFVPRQRNRIVAALQDGIGNPIANADVRLTIDGTTIRNQPLAEQPGRGDYSLDLTMPAQGGQLWWTVEARLPGSSQVLRQQGPLIGTS